MTATSELTATAPADDLFGHPKGLYICFATELWERFSFYGMKFLLLLYLTKYHLFTDEAGYDVLGAYAGLVYALPVIGGLLADRYLGMRKAVVFGAVLLSAGHLLMAYEGQQALHFASGTVLNAPLTLNDGSIIAAGTRLADEVIIQDVIALNVFFLALALIAVGVGFLKPNISTIVGQLYGDDDPRRDSGFTIFYMGINIGSFVAILLCGWLGETFGWGYGFGAAGIGMLLGLTTFLRGQKYLCGLADPSSPEQLKQPVLGPINREWTIYLCGLLSLGAVWYLLQYEPVVHMAQNALLALALIGLLLFAYLKGTKDEFQRTLVLMVLIASSVVFWALFEQSAGSMTLYADRIVNREVMGTELRASMFGSLNPFFIIVFAPLFAGLWVWLARRGWEPSTPVKFALGIFQAGLGFGAMVIGAQFLGADGKVAILWLTLAYLLHTTGELCISPVGLSAVTKLSIKRVVGVSMGTWFLATALSETVATRIGKLAAIDTHAGETQDLAHALATYTELYSVLMWIGIGVGVFMLLISPLLRKGMHGVH
ncbi:peptide MFS transporter [Aestuariicella hydrocarbonica]|uniref:Peptide MFS transporter n=1 Tax=Pseudomaricurvus hydrocarbonicus TaxID=1470433 RepID=A0A9E5MQI1_9GAMM|nr:peptide MFS transporter [Aestuariicella hydrocarbonica]NHO68561.1 peptide MFS transporter [Aestuariicella hydrocarbonica]